MLEATINRRGIIFILSSPSGGGKTTISRRLLEKHQNLSLSISATTREARGDEVEGEHYFFLDKNTFQQKIINQEFLEYAEVFGEFYGTPKEAVERSLQAGTDVLFDIDWQGTFQLAQHARKDIVSVFILPPSMQELERRLKKRGRDTEHQIAERMAKATHEISHWYSYDYVIINNDIEESINKVSNILQAERLRRIRQQDMGKFVESLLHSEEH